MKTRQLLTFLLLVTLIGCKEELWQDDAELAPAEPGILIALHSAKYH